MPISLKKLIKESSKFSGSTLLSKLLSLPVMIFLGRKLGAEDFGTVASITLVLQYAGLITPGFINAGAREIAHYYGEGDGTVAEKVESIANGADLLFSFLIFIFMFLASLFQKRQIYSLGFIIISFIFLSDRIKTYYFNANYYRQIYNINVAANTISSVITPLASIGLVFMIREYALLVAPLLASLSATVFYLVFSKQKVRFSWNVTETKKLFKVGIVLSLGGIVFWAFRLADRTAITLLMSKSDLGYYFYAMNFILMAINILSDFGRVLESMLWSETGRFKEGGELYEDIARLSLFIACVGGAAIPALQLGYYLLVITIVPKFTNTIELFNIMSLSIYPVLTLMVPNILLKSKTMNKQHCILIIYSVATAFNFIADVIAIKLGYSLNIVSWLSLATLLAVSFCLLSMIRNYVSSSTRDFVTFMGKLLVPFATSIIVYIAAALIPKITCSSGAFVLCFICIQMIAWTPFMIFKFYALSKPLPAKAAS